MNKATLHHLQNHLRESPKCWCMSGEDQRERWGWGRWLGVERAWVEEKKWEDEGKILISDAPRLFLHLVNHFTKLLVSSFFPNMRSHTNFLLSSSCLLYARTHAHTHALTWGGIHKQVHTQWHKHTHTQTLTQIHTQTLTQNQRHMNTIEHTRRHTLTRGSTQLCSPVQ